jgi:hypothetical protein
MAQALSSRPKEDEGLTQAKYLEFLDRWNDVEEELADAQETVRSIRKRRKDLRATMTASGVNLDAFDRALKDAERSGGEREAEDAAYRRFMAWRNKPVGFQASIDLKSDDAGLAALNVHQLKAIDNEGMEAGRSGHERNSNSYTPGTEAYQRWDAAWLRGQAEIASSMAPEPAKRGRGRPPGTGKNQRAAAEAAGKPDLTVHEGGAGNEPGPDDTRH